MSQPFILALVLLSLASGEAIDRIKDLVFTEGQCDIPLCNLPPRVEHLDSRTTNIWGLVQIVPVWQVHQIFDAALSRECLHGKKVLLLGDSVLAEQVTDFALLLGDPDEATRVHILETLRTPGLIPIFSQTHPVGSQTTVHRHPIYRNQTVKCEASNTLLRYRFTGHHVLTENNAGISTFFHEDFQLEFEQLLAISPDIIIVNSGLHDDKTRMEDFENVVVKLADRLRTTGARVFWRGNVWDQRDPKRNERLVAYDVIAKREFEARGMGFINISSVIQQIFCHPQMKNSELRIAGDQHHYGSCFWTGFRSQSPVTLIQAHITQAVLNALCP